ncbi:hypothetical protein NPIL_390121 [Nephila pilipes]|uniref:Endonuclease/exonuclease/phosphatase domain-containing protein n=1 Tax=Nephila pilipes TaxID=299642 RepID=A0A8X6QSX4_NEPPI|nr:hypothetical protein NPIL_390121 [Nephila pilipes]
MNLSDLLIEARKRCLHISQKEIERLQSARDQVASSWGNEIETPFITKKLPRRWKPPGTNTPGKVLYQYATKYNLQINAPEQATRQTHRPNNSIIDICVSKGLYSITSESIPALLSDHNPVLFEIETDNLTSQTLNSIKITNW